MLSISNTGYWTGGIIVNQLSSVLIESPLRISGTLLVFSFFSLVMILFILLIVPETKVKLTWIQE
jgi:hypothetical protein